MSIIRHVHVYCDVCDEPLQHAVDGRDSVADQLAAAKRNRWTRLRVDGKLYDVCDGCSMDSTPNELRRRFRAKAK